MPNASIVGLPPYASKDVVCSRWLHFPGDHRDGIMRRGCAEFVPSDAKHPQERCKYAEVNELWPICVHPEAESKAKEADGLAQEHALEKKLELL